MSLAVFDSGLFVTFLLVFGSYSWLVLAIIGTETVGVILLVLL